MKIQEKVKVHALTTLFLNLNARSVKSIYTLKHNSALTFHTHNKGIIMKKKLFEAL